VLFFTAQHVLFDTITIRIIIPEVIYCFMPNAMSVLRKKQYHATFHLVIVMNKTV
jgi:hypothetical protein